MTSLRTCFKAALLSAALASAAPAFADTNHVINFEDLTAGTTLSNQYAALGATFTPNAYSGAGGPNGDWATNTDMTIVSLSGTDVGGIGSPSLVSGNVLRSFNGWLAEDGDNSFRISFNAPVTSISIDFAGISEIASTGFDVYGTNGALITHVGATGTGQQRLTYTGTLGSVVVTAGEYFDWVGVDNVSYTITAVPEPETYGLMALGLGIVAVAARRRQR